MRRNNSNFNADSSCHTDEAFDSHEEPQTPHRLSYPTRPSYMTVGTNTTTENVLQLQAILDSGYEGSSIDAGHGSIISSGQVSHDRPDQPSEADIQKSIHQHWYNVHRASLGRSLENVVRLLEGFREMNRTWHIHYPSVHGAGSCRKSFESSSATRSDSTSSSTSNHLSPPLEHCNTETESSKAAGKEIIEAPRSDSLQIAQEFSILNLDLKLGSLQQSELVYTLGNDSIATLLDGRINSSLRHLQSLRERLEDISSKVLVTGDVNAGKSTFCNALLRRKILPEDQQPCTAIFCEVLDAKENGGLEEVHASKINYVYNRDDERTFDVYTIRDLPSIVWDNLIYSQCKVYVRDTRIAQQSLLSNGLVHISLIDAPGLNSHTAKTTAVFARQEEIDVVVFVVSASNHFTISAQDFIKTAAADKAYLFIVVNGFDTIMDKERCERAILIQVAKLSAKTYKEASELVHFVSSNSVSTDLPNTLNTSSHSRGRDDPSDDDAKGKGKEVEKIRDFENMEDSLRRFVLEKRARSKLAPAKNYLLNILHDVNILAAVNCDFAQAKAEAETLALQDIEPQLESSREAKKKLDFEIERIVEDTCHDVYQYTRSNLDSAIAHASESSSGVVYPGFFNAFQYAENLQDAILAHIASSVNVCEDYGRNRTFKGVNVIKQLGILHLTDGFENFNFHPEAMFRRRKDVVARQLEISTELLDFIEWPVFDHGDKFPSTSVALTVATALGGGRLFGIRSWMEQAFATARLVGNDNLRRLVVPGILAAALLATTFVISQIPNALPRRLSTKIANKLATIDYVHLNAARISGRVRKVLRFPADNLRFSLDRSIEDLGARREKSLLARDQSIVALKYFSNLVRDSTRQTEVLEDCNLEASPGNF